MHVQRREQLVWRQVDTGDGVILPKGERHRVGVEIGPLLLILILLQQQEPSSFCNGVM